MTDGANGISAGQDVNASLPVVNNAAISQDTTAGKSFSQSELNDIVGRAKHEAVERFKRANLNHDENVNWQQSANHQKESPDIKVTVAEEVQKAMETAKTTAQRQAQEQEAQRIAAEFLTKLQAGKDEIENFDQIMANTDYSRIGNTVQLVRNFDNVSQIMVELKKDPIKMMQIENLTYFDAPGAYKLLSEMSQALKDNKAAGKAKVPNEPLSHLKPTNTGTDTGVMSVRDYRKKYRM